MAAALSRCITFLLLFSFFFHLNNVAFGSSDLTALLEFKASADPSNTILTRWTPASDPCFWPGISCFQNRVSRLVLENLSLRGSFQPLARLTELRILSLKYNHFSGPIPNLSNLTSLKLLFLSHNKFSGDFPQSVTSLTRLYRLDLSFNQLSGVIPAPQGEPTRPGSGALASPVGPRGNSSTVASSPTTLPDNGSPVKTGRNNGGGKMSTVAIVFIILGDVIVLTLIAFLLYCFFWRRYSKKMSRKNGEPVEKIVYSSSPYPNPPQPGYERGKMVFFDGSKKFELEDLLRASAEMLGKGGFGTAYKAVLDDGNVVAVKRLKEMSVNGRRDFENQMEILGRIKHPNLVSLKAYYFARDEKLLVNDFMPNGNLFWLLHGNRGPGRTPLDWTSRLRIASGAAKGLLYIHNSCKPLKLVHGNIKSTNVLIDKTGNARLTDFGLSAFALPSSAPKSNGYRAPEASVDGRKLTQQCDVYSFGVLLLELLTGKCPSIADNGGQGTGYTGILDLPRWVQSVVREEWTAEVFDIELMRYKGIEEEMVGLLQIAMACSSASPDQRPKMNFVVKMIEELRGVEMSPSHDTLDSVSDSPAVSEDAGAVACQ
ncbi:OLC1v1032233C1 [Oldenlandia corymbosa var. corymbosa]|uniref:OLC1v1032233C1 n=1 Tax=Oldenlandia corymbosa var. corymbosa TaxID=529605 RepID=A0AAV1CME2_OLDCO|nr:OLC1v1032233C1 [Oldenlandia corymbosa var. corymbosa]